MFNIFSKSGVVGIIEVILLLGVGISATIYMSDWASENFNIYVTDKEFESEIGDLELLGLKSSGPYASILGIRNVGLVVHNVSFVKIGGRECRILSSKEIGNIQNLELNCNVNQFDTYDIDVISNFGIYSKVLTVWEEHIEDLTLNIPFKVSFDFGTSCVDSIRLYGMNYTNNSHAEIPSSSVYTYGVCASHDEFILGNVPIKLLFSILSSCRFVKCFQQ